MGNQGEESPQLAESVDAYASWVRDLRLGNQVGAPPPGGGTALSRLGEELRLLTAAIHQREAEMQKLFDIVHQVEHGILVEDVLDKVYSGFANLIPYERIGCAFLTDDGARLTAYWAKSRLGDVQLSQGYSQPIAGSSLEAILRTRRPRVLNDLVAYLAEHPASEATRLIVGEGGRASLTCPLIVEDQPIGFLFFTSSRRNAYRKAHQTIFLRIAEEVATVIHKSYLYQRLVEANRDMMLQSSHLREIAARDPLTGVLNRGAIMEALERKLAAAGRRHPFGVIMIDVDHFKHINDTYGHGAGDDVLREFTRRLTAGLRQNDDLGRYGGEEFLVLIAETEQANVLRTAERLRRVIADAPFEHDGMGLAVTASFGVAFSGCAGVGAAALLKMADRALYRAKASGRNRCAADDAGAAAEAAA